MPDYLNCKIEVTGRKPGVVNNTTESDAGQARTFFIFTDSASTYPAAGNLLDGTLQHNGLNIIDKDNIDGGVDSVPMQLRYYFDRNGVTETGVQISVIYKYGVF